MTPRDEASVAPRDASVAPRGETPGAWPDAASGALLRLAAIPLRAWLAGGSPELFAGLREADEAAAAYRASARATAADIGALLVPHPALDASARAGALRVRRALHNGGVPAERDAVAAARDAARLLPGGGLSAAILGLLDAGTRSRDAREELARTAEAEQERLLSEPWRLLHDLPSARNALLSGDLAVYDDIVARVAAKEPWTTKRMRQRSAYLWRMLTRGGTRATPRGWLAHVAWLPVGDGGWAGDRTLEVDADAAADHAENLDRARSARDAAETVDDDALISLAPLLRLDPGQLVLWVFDGDRRARLNEVRLRRTGALDAVLAALDGGPRRAGQVLDDLAGQDEARRRALAGLLAHLVRQSALQVGTPVRRRLGEWRPVTRADERRGDPDGFVDVYRRAPAGIAGSHARELDRLARLALRLSALIDQDAAGEEHWTPSGVGREPRPLLEVADLLSRDRDDRPEPACRHVWPVPRHADSGYARLLAALTRRMGGGGRLDVDERLLDEVGAPRVRLDWPIDCLMRPLRRSSGAVAVLDEIAPAGVLDARFVPALTSLHGALPQADAYRGFLAGQEKAGGASFVELLVPPLHPQAANAVLRPSYTTLWTGDPDRSGYLPHGQAGYLPLSRITLRAEEGEVVAEARGERIWPVTHTARVAPPFWSTVAALLALASPQPDRDRWRVPQFSLPAWPERDFVPRITVGNELVVTPAQWRLVPADLWRPADRLIDKLAALERLQRSREMPRLVGVCADLHDPPLAVDLHSLHGLGVLERLVQRGGTDIVFRELLAEPAALPVHDSAVRGDGPSVAELLLRLSADRPAPHPHARPAGRAQTSWRPRHEPLRGNAP